jgi:hypothetical protein
MQQRNAAFKRSNKSKNFRLGGMKKVSAPYKKKNSESAQRNVPCVMQRVAKVNLEVVEAAKLRKTSKAKVIGASKVGV